MSSSEKKPEKFAEIDEKVKAVFDKKGYQLQCKVGSGAFGQVYRAVNVKRDNRLCAVKVMDMTKMSSKRLNKFLPREIAAHIEVKHPNAVSVYDIFIMNKKVLQFFWMVKKDYLYFHFIFSSFPPTGLHIYGVLLEWRPERLPEEEQGNQRGPGGGLVPTGV